MKNVGEDPSFSELSSWRKFIIKICSRKGVQTTKIPVDFINLDKHTSSKGESYSSHFLLSF